MKTPSNRSYAIDDEIASNNPSPFRPDASERAAHLGRRISALIVS